jgi:hypothetical protein
VTGDRAKLQLDAGVWTAGIVGLILLLLATGDFRLTAALTAAWTMLLPMRGFALPLLVAIFLPATIDLGLPRPMATMLYLMTFGALALFALRNGLRGGSVAVRIWGPFLTAVVVMGVAAGGTGSDLAAALRPLVALVALSALAACGATQYPGQFQRLLRIVIYLSAATGLLAIYQVITGGWPILDRLAIAPQYTSATYFGRPGGVMGHPILLGAVLGFSAILCLAIRPRYWRIALTLCLVGVALSGSRSAFAAGAVALLVHAAPGARRLRLSRLVVPGVLIAAAVAFAAPMSKTLSTQIDSVLGRLSISGDVSYAARGSRSSVAWDIITSHPQWFWFGQGPRADAHYILSRGLGDKLALTFDNYYLIVWFNYGLIGVLALLLALVGAWRTGGRGTKALVAFVAAEMLFFDAAGWVSMLALLALTVGFAAFEALAPRQANDAPQSVRQFAPSLM